jgi:hypothetical protein
MEKLIQEIMGNFVPKELQTKNLHTIKPQGGGESALTQLPTFQGRTHHSQSLESFQQRRHSNSPRAKSELDA